MSLVSRIFCILTFVAFTGSLLKGTSAKAQTVPLEQTPLHPWRTEDVRAGYSEATSPENEEVGEILYKIEDPRTHEDQLQNRIFNEKLSKEFAQRYAEQFGRTEPEIIYNRTPYLTSNYTENQSLTFDEEEYQKEQKKFGRFMVKRLFEYHLQNEAKTNPQLKTVNNVKETVEKVDVSITPNFKLRAKYHIPSNTARFSVLNPYIDFSARLELEKTLGFNRILEKIFSFQKEFKPLLLTTFADYYTTQKRLDLIFRLPLNAQTSVSLTLSPFRDTEISTNVFVLERLVLGGIGYVF